MEEEFVKLVASLLGILGTGGSQYYQDEHMLALYQVLGGYGEMVFVEEYRRYYLHITTPKVMRIDSRGKRLFLSNSKFTYGDSNQKGV